MSESQILPRLLDVAKAATYMSVGKKVICALVRSGKLPRVNISEKRYLIDREDLDRLVESEKSAVIPAPIIAPAQRISSGSKRSKKSEKPYEWARRAGYKG